MSITSPNRWERFELTFRCDFCRRGPGEWCVTKTGHYSGLLHASRHYAAREEVDRERNPHQEQGPGPGESTPQV